MGEKTNIFIHIGAYKTGTTTLQNLIFPFWPNMVYVNDLYLSYIVLLDENKKYIISNETLFGRPWKWHGASERRNNGLRWEDERRLIIKALSRLFPDAQILLSLRNHAHFILSLYKQYLHEGGVKKLGEFYDFYQNRGVIRRDDINYMPTINLLEQSFKLKPFVFTLDEIQNNLHGLIQKFEVLFGEKAPNLYALERKSLNPGVNYWQAKLLRILNIIDKGSLLKPGGLMKLRNDFLLKYRIDPRTICQERLGGMSKKPINFDKNYEELVNFYYAEDWRKTKEFIKTNWSNIRPYEEREETG